MGKYFPMIISFMVFTGFLAIQVGLDIATSARSPATSDVQRAYYNDVFQKQTFKDTKGKKIVLAKAKAPVVIINFWASWCAPCLIELPSLVKISKKYGPNKVLILGVNSDEVRQKRAIRRLTRKYAINFPIVADAKGSILDKFKVSRIPTTLIFKKGKLVRHIEGTEDFISGEMMEFFDGLLK